MKLGDTVREKTGSKRYGIIISEPEGEYVKVKIMTPIRGVPAGGTATLWKQGLEVVSKIPASKTGAPQKEKFQQRLAETFAQKPYVPKDLQPLFAHLLRLAAHSYEVGYPQRAGQELRKAQKMIKKF